MYTLYFDVDNRKLVTLEDLRKEYPVWLLNRAAECGIPYVLRNMQDFTFETWVECCLTGMDGTLIPVFNCENFRKVGDNNG